jgi:hypothetical protein
VDYVGTEASADFRVTDVLVATQPSRLAEAQIVAENWRVDPAFSETGAVIWTAEVRNTTSTTLEFVQVEFSTYDAAGKVLAVDFAFLDPIPAGETQLAEGFGDYHGGAEASAKFRIAAVE